MMQELSKLTADERAAIRQRWREFEEKDGSLFLHEAADSMFKDMGKHSTIV